MSETGDRWVDAGRFTACGVVDEQIYAVLYWSAGFAALNEPDGSNLADTGSGWFLAFADDPNAHIKLSGPALVSIADDTAHEDLDRAMRAAAGIAGAIIRQRLGRGS